jgi:hypothetical protein
MYRVNVRTIILHRRGELELLAKKIRRNKILQILGIILIPSVLYTLIFVGSHKQNVNTDVVDNLMPLYVYMLVSRILLLIIFIGSAVLLLRSLKSYSLKIYYFSRFKILLTLILGTISLSLDSINYLLLTLENDLMEESILHSWKETSLTNDVGDYQLFILFYVLVSEFLPMISLQVSLLISYKNNS